jgi:hypothetical protein
VTSGGGISLDQLRVAARYDRDRLALYRARALTGKPTSPVRMRALQHAAERSEERLRRALDDAGSPLQ